MTTEIVYYNLEAENPALKQVSKPKYLVEWKWASDHEMIKSKKFTSAYILDGLLIDTTAPAGVDDFISFFTDFQNNPEKYHQNIPISLCIITHFHEDHTGAGKVLEEKFNIPIFASEKSKDYLMQEYTYPIFRQIYWGEKREAFSSKICKDSIRTPGGNYNFKLIDIPGHSPDMIALVNEENEIIFTSDAVMPKYQMIFGGKCDIKEDIKQIYESLRKIYEISKNMKNPKIFASHFLQITPEFLKERIDEISDLHAKVHKVKSSLMEQGITRERKLIRGILKEIFGGEYSMAAFTNGQLSRENLVRSLLKWNE